MTIGFYGNANNYPFALAEGIRRLGHRVEFIVVSRERLSRPEHRYPGLGFPYPPWIFDASHRMRWRCLVPGLGRRAVLERLNRCDAVILNEEGPALARHLQVPHGVLLTGSDIEVFADPSLAPALKAQAFPQGTWTAAMGRRLFPTSLIRRWLTEPQRAGIRSAKFVAFMPRGLVPNVDRLLTEIGVDPVRRLEVLFTDCTVAPYVPPPLNRSLRLFCATRLTWRQRPGSGLTTLDLKGSDLMLRGIAQFLRRTGARIDLHLVRKGRDVAESAALAEELGLRPHLTWHDEMNQMGVLSQFRQSDVVFEQFGSGSIGMAGLDALATGRPLIANARPDVFERVTGGPSPILQATTPQEISDRLEAVSSSPAFREKIGRASRAYVEKHFSAEAAAAACLSRFVQS